jgi:hypothetical protein
VIRVPSRPAGARERYAAANAKAQLELMTIWEQLLGYMAFRTCRRETPRPRICVQFAPRSENFLSEVAGGFRLGGAEAGPVHWSQRASPGARPKASLRRAGINVNVRFRSKVDDQWLHQSARAA